MRYLLLSLLAPALLGCGSSNQQLVADANELYDSGDFKGAIVVYSLALRDTPEDVELLLRRGKAYLATNQRREGIEDLTTVLRLAPDRLEARATRGLVWVELEQLTKAIDDLTQCLDADPSRKDLRRSRGRALLSVGRGDDAITDFRKLVELGGDDEIEPLVELGRALFLSNRLDEAEATLTKAIEIDKQPAAALFYRARVFKSQGKTDEAIADRALALRIDPSLALIDSTVGSTLAGSDGGDRLIGERIRANIQ